MSEGFAWGGPAGRGLIRACPDDFEVEEVLGHEPSGEGEHLWLWIEKREHNTVDVAGMLARAAGLHPRQVSFAGLKDRNAVTRQYFSLHLAGRDDPDWHAADLPGVRVLSGQRSARKIQRGRLHGNRFTLVVRGLEGDRDEIEQRLLCLRDHGAPNGFGEQRFGGNNIARARALFAGQLRRKPSKHKRGFYLSAARSLLFNQVLRQRIDNGSWNRILEGEVAMLDGSRSFFLPDPADPAIRERCERLDVHPTGPLAGAGDSPLSGEVAELEQAVFAAEPDLVLGLQRFGLRHERRPLRMRIGALEWSEPEPNTLKLAFTLGQGSYATSVLRELIDYDLSTESRLGSAHGRGL
ncbi:tRNA pseudouridine(13) synthase TruD [Wenzhouxiangella limi]|uniref:tRNA pseudouridine(13) synthase TruD n=1 Tax=Wenzhouxiangella limi TaxID=2707351 RepID=UPI0030B84289